MLTEKNKICRYYFFIGTEAELIKLLPVLLEMKKRKVVYKIIATGQNNILKSHLLTILKKKPEIILYNKHIDQTPLGLFLWFIKTFIKAIFQLRKEFKNVKRNKVVILVHGDTVTTVLGTALAKLFRFKLAHIESGLRSFNFFHPFPEEIDRIIPSFFADFHFCPNSWAVNNLKGRGGIKINTFQNTLIDSLQIVNKLGIKSPLMRKLKKEKYAIFVIHRQENLYNKKLLKILISELVSISKTIKGVFILHELTEYNLKQADLLGMLKRSLNIILTPRLEYAEFMKVLENAEFIVTDGGSNQEESYYFGKPCLILREHTERIEGLGENVILSKNDLKRIKYFINNYKKYVKSIIIPKVSPSKIIVDYLIDNA